MKTLVPSTPVLRTVCRLVAACLLAAAPAAPAQVTNYAKKVLHDDGTVTESVSDLAKNELRESTFDTRGVLISKRIVLLNERGYPVQGVIYSGTDDVLGRVEFYYDDLGRPTEERSLNSQGQVFRRRFQLYDQGGRPLPAKVVDYAANAPNVPSNSINFTRMVPAPGQRSPSTASPEQTARLPGQAPQIQSVSPRSSTPQEPEKKKSWNPFRKN